MKVFNDRACVLFSSFASLLALHLTKNKVSIPSVSNTMTRFYFFLSIRHDLVVRNCISCYCFIALFFIQLYKNKTKTKAHN